jgi:hypothetical protein
MRRVGEVVDNEPRNELRLPDARRSEVVDDERLEEPKHLDAQRS